MCIVQIQIYRINGDGKFFQSFRLQYNEQYDFYTVTRTMDEQLIQKIDFNKKKKLTEN